MSEEIERSIHTLLDQSDDLIEAGDLGAALQRAEEARRLALAHRAEVSVEMLAVSHAHLVGLLIDADAPDRALALGDEIADLLPDNEEVWLGRGMALLSLLRLDEARRELERCAPDGPVAPEALWHRAVLAEFRGEMEEADRLFAEAHRLAPEAVALPVRLSADEVERLLGEVIEALPEEIRAALDAVAIQIDPLPDPAALREQDPPFSPFILGLHTGTAWGEKSVFDAPHDLDRILIFQRNIERIAGDPAALREEMRTTLLHEIGHHLGWNEDDLATRGLA